MQFIQTQSQLSRYDMDTSLTPLPNLIPARATTNCCPLIDPLDWDGKTFIFDDKLFAKTTTRSFMHIPLNMGQVMKRAQEKIDAANARSDDLLTLSDEVSPWHADHYLAVTHDVPHLAMTKLSGRFMTKVFEGQYKNAGKWHTELQEYARSQEEIPIKIYFFYTVCPGCAKTYGKNYVIGFVKISEKFF